jgi:hypothetical protein
MIKSNQKIILEFGRAEPPFFAFFALFLYPYLKQNTILSFELEGQNVNSQISTRGSVPTTKGWSF